MQKKTVYIGVGVAVVAVVAIAGIVIASSKNDTMLRYLSIPTSKSSKPVDYDATASMWEDEERVYKAASKLDM